MGVRVCTSCTYEESPTPTVQVSVTALPIAEAYKLPKNLERLVDFVREEIRRDNELRSCPECGSKLRWKT